MDTSETYIKMCDCEEIQSIFKGFDLNKFPNYAYDKVTERVSIILWTPNRLREMVRNKGNVLIVSVESDREKNQYVPEYEGDFCDSVIWLPRQDQLQETLGEKDPRILLLSFHRFTHPADGMHIREEDFEEVKEKTKYRSLFDSMEQLWLVFVMKKKYNKTRDGSGWIST